ncbi:MAG: B12-binding domain-containing radical SAM protein [Candidatus Omnitrophica bacterium]|nr:B12-binding domain-containing radical SAM protein [Candidatus Omnitrophota bacterium]
MNKSKKVLLFTMPIPDLLDPGAQKYLFDTRSIVNLPYGLLSICAYVKKYARNCVNFRIVDINNHLVSEYQHGNVIRDGQEYFRKYIESETGEFNPDIVGISLMFNVGYHLLDGLAATIKKVAPNTLLIVGGNLATVLSEEIALKNDIDAVNFGEGEIPFLRLIDSEDSRAHVRSNNAFVTKESIKLGIKPANYTVSELDNIPPIDFSYVDLSNFNLPKIKGAVYKKNFKRTMVSRIIYLSRGCPFNCNFCAGFNVHGKKVRFLSAERAVNDVRKMVEDDGLTELFVCDDSFLLDKVRAKLILKEYVKLKINVNFPAILMRNIDDEVAQLLSQLGNTFQYTSLESGSDFVLKHIIQKPVTKDEAKCAVHSLRKFGISALTNIVIGSPGETDEHRNETLETLEEIGFSWVYFLIALPLPGSRLYNECKENGYLVNDSFFCPSLTKCNIRTPSYTPEHIEKQAYMMNLHVNFIHNYNLRIGNYDECIKSFSNLVNVYSDHAFAYYCLAKAYEGKGELDRALVHKGNFRSIINTSSFWKDWAVYFNLI